jgi:hypothetical protein
MEKLIKQYSGHGQLILDNNEAVPVSYQIAEFQGYDGDVLTLRNTRGRVAHLEGHPDWHPITFLHPGPFTLVMSDRRKLKVLLITPEGDVQGTGGFF